MVEITADTGQTGIGFGMTRDSPVASHRGPEPGAVPGGRGPAAHGGTRDALYYRTCAWASEGFHARPVRAWTSRCGDLKGQAAGLPVWRLLGGARARVPLSVAGRSPGVGPDAGGPGRGDRGLCPEDSRTVKLAAGELAEDTVRLRAARRVLGPDIALAHDVHWAFRDLASGGPTVRSWADIDIAFLEDRFPSELGRALGEAARADRRSAWRSVRTRSAAGRSGICCSQHEPDLLRVDATVAGGLSEAAKICALRVHLGVPVFPHVFPEVPVRLGAAFPGVADGGDDRPDLPDRDAATSCSRSG